MGGADVSSPSVDADVMLPVVLILSLSVNRLLAGFPVEESSSADEALSRVT